MDPIKLEMSKGREPKTDEKPKDLNNFIDTKITRNAELS